MSNSEIVRLNVGGTKYITTKSTLRKYPLSMLGAMFREDLPLSTDEDGYYFIDRCGHIFQYILQFLRCGRLVLPEGFNELELLQLEADFYQIKDLISAVEHLKKEVKVKEDDEVNLMLFSVLHYRNVHDEERVLIKVFNKSKETDFKYANLNFLFSNSRDENAVRDYLKSDGWVLKQRKTLGKSGACIFFKMRGISTNEVFHDESNTSRYESCESIHVETWIRSPDISF